MGESVQTSVEEINLIAAQLRYKIESTLQLSSQQRQHAQSAKDERLSEITTGEHYPESRLNSNETSSASALENDFLHREVLDLKQVIEKLSTQLRAKETMLKSSKDELKQEKQSREVDFREQRKIIADSKSNERYMKCLQIEYELLRSITAKSQEAYLLIGGESMKQATELDKTSKMVKKQMKEILEINEENKSLLEEVKKLNIVITKLRATAGVNFSILKQSQLGMEKTDEKKNQLLSRQVSLTERLDKERHLNKMLQQTVEECERKETTALEGISLASQQQATLVKRSAILSYCRRKFVSDMNHYNAHQFRLNDFSSEIAYLKDLVHEQQSKISTYEKNAVSSNHNTAYSAAANTSFVAPINDSSNANTLDLNRTTKAAAAHDGSSYSATDRRDTSEKPLFSSNDQEQLQGRGRLIVQEDSAGMAGKSRDEALHDVEPSQSVKRRKTELSDHIQSASMESDQGEHSYWGGVDEGSTQAPLPPVSNVIRSGRSEVNVVAPQHVSPGMAALEQGMEDDRCPVCLDCPFGLMVLCSGCRNALHSACAKRTGGGTTGIPAVNCSFTVTAVYTQ